MDLQQLQIQRDAFIKAIGREIQGQFKSELRANPFKERTIDELRGKYIRNQDFMTANLNSYSHDLAFRRQIVPATRGTVKKVVYGM